MIYNIFLFICGLFLGVKFFIIYKLIKENCLMWTIKKKPLFFIYCLVPVLNITVLYRVFTKLK